MDETEAIRRGIRRGLMIAIDPKMDRIRRPEPRAESTISEAWKTTGNRLHKMMQQKDDKHNQ